MIDEKTIFSEDNTHNLAVSSAIKYLNTYGYFIEKGVSYKTKENYKSDTAKTIVYRDNNEEDCMEITTTNTVLHDKDFIKITIRLKLSRNTEFIGDKIKLHKSVLLYKYHLDMIDQTVQNILNQFIFWCD